MAEKKTGGRGRPRKTLSERAHDLEATVWLCSQLEREEKVAGERVTTLRKRLEVKWGVGSGDGNTWRQYRAGRRALSKPVRTRLLNESGLALAFDLLSASDNDWWLGERHRPYQVAMGAVTELVKADDIESLEDLKVQVEKAISRLRNYVEQGESG